MSSSSSDDQGPPVYNRSSFRFPAAGSFSIADGHEWVGTLLTVRIGGVALATGTVVDVRPVDNGTNLFITIESGGRTCTCCRHIYAEGDEAENMLGPLEQVSAASGDLDAYESLPVWVLVCRDQVACEERRRERDERLRIERLLDT